MSVTVHLYRQRPDVSYKGTWLDGLKLEGTGEQVLESFKLAAIANGGPSGNDDELFKWIDDCTLKAWSDNQNHSKLEFTEYMCSIEDDPDTVDEKVKQFRKLKVQSFTDVNNCTVEYVAADEVQYHQGWFFNKKFFDKNTWRYLLTSKEEIEAFYNEYMTFEDEHCVEAEQAKEVFDKLMSAFEDGMYVDVAW